MKKLLLIASFLQPAIISAGILSVTPKTEREILIKVMGKDNVTESSSIKLPLFNMTIQVKVKNALENKVCTIEEIITLALMDAKKNNPERESTLINFNNVQHALKELNARKTPSHMPGILSIDKTTEHKILKNVMGRKFIQEAQIIMPAPSQEKTDQIKSALNKKICTIEELITHIATMKYFRQPRDKFEINNHDIDDAIDHFERKYERKHQEIFEIEL